MRSHSIALETVQTSWVDICVADFLYNYMHLYDKALFEKHPLVDKFTKKVMSISKVVDYVKTRRSDVKFD